MADSIKINKLEIENVKRIKAVKIEPTKNGLTIVGGNNNQGKTSVLDSIAWALGGDKYKPSNATRDGSTIPPNLHIVMSNGLVVERKGKNSNLKETYRMLMLRRRLRIPCSYPEFRMDRLDKSRWCGNPWNCRSGT